MMTTLLQLEKVSSAYGQSKVLWDVDMDIEQGSAVALIGRNGVGKTTLLNTMVGVQKLTGGKITFAGQDVSAAAAHHRARAGIGYVPQGRHVFPQLSVMENLTVGLAALSGRKALTESGIASHIFDLFPKLTQIRARKAGLLSGGEQQQLAIGRALAGQPKLLLLDEPTEGIQPSVVKQIEHALRRIRRELGVTIVIVEQYLDFAWSFADRFHIMQRGQIVRSGNTADETTADIAHLVNI
jgi:urea transport system ATP-binding protein